MTQDKLPAPFVPAKYVRRLARCRRSNGVAESEPQLMPRQFWRFLGGEFGVGFSREKIMIKVRLLQLVLVLLVWTSQGSAQFAHTEHKQIVDGAGKPLLVRATNLGNWMVPEGYMWLFQGGPQSPGEIRALVLELLGPEGSAAFWQKYRENYVTREDIALLHRPGFN